VGSDDIQEQLADLQQTFALFDRDGDGRIAVDEFRSILSVMGLDVSTQEAEDMVMEVDSDGTGTMDISEFIMMMGKKQEQTSTDLEGAWSFLDPDGVGSFKADGLKQLVVKSGIQLDCWELKEMIDTADLNKDGLIDRAEFMQASKGLAWHRCRRLGQVHDEVTTTWKMLDTEGSGEVDISAIDACFKRLGCAATDTQLREMLRTADENQDGKVSFQEFAVAYHSKTWRRARLLGPTHLKVRKLRTTQERNYAAWHNREVEEAKECGLFPSGVTAMQSRKAGLMARRKLRRDNSVRRAVTHLWDAQAGARQTTPSALDGDVDLYGEARDWVQKDLFVTTMMHVAKHVADDEHFFVEGFKGLIEEEWDGLVKTPVDITTLTLHQKNRATKGDLRWLERPEGWKCIGYGKFFGAIFEAADSEIGFELNEISGERYASFIKDLYDQMLTEGPDSYSWVHPELCEGSCPKTFKKVGLEALIETDVTVDPNSLYAKKMMEHAATSIERIGRGHITRAAKVREMLKRFGITQGEYDICKRDFNDIDTDSSGSLTGPEMRCFMQMQLARPPTDDEVNDVTHSMDFNDDGRVTLDEYLTSIYCAPNPVPVRVDTSEADRLAAQRRLGMV